LFFAKQFWQNDESMIFLANLSLSKAAWYDDSDFLYDYSNTIKQALAWTRKLSEEVTSKRGRKKETLFCWYFGKVL
jgi:hypothetical protein